MEMKHLKTQKHKGFQFKIDLIVWKSEWEETLYGSIEGLK